MRLLTAHALVKHKEVMLSAFAHAFPSSSLEDHKLKFETALIKAVRVSDWGTDYHIFALSMLLHRPIFQYSMDPNHTKIPDTLTVEQFVQCFASRKLGTTRHLLYCTSVHKTVLATFHCCPLLSLICKITTG